MSVRCSEAGGRKNNNKKQKQNTQTKKLSLFYTNYTQANTVRFCLFDMLHVLSCFVLLKILLLISCVNRSSGGQWCRHPPAWGMSNVISFLSIWETTGQQITDDSLSKDCVINLSA